MCGGAIISDWVPPPRSSSRLTDSQLWGCSDRQNKKKNNKKRNASNYRSKSLRSENVDFEADFLDFKDFSDDEEAYSLDIKPFAFSASELSAGSESLISVDANKEVEKSSKRQRKNQYRGIRKRPWGKWAAETCSRTPDISSVLSAAIECDEAQFIEGVDLEEKPKSCSNNLVPDDVNTAHKPPEEFSTFESQMKFYQTPYSEGNLDVPVDAFLNADATQGGENAMNLWSFDELSSLMGGV